jgi:hypothetical protein
MVTGNSEAIRSWQKQAISASKNCCVMGIFQQDRRLVSPEDAGSS